MTLLIWIVIGIGVGYVASRRPGFSVVSCVVAGMVLGPLAALLFWLPAGPGGSSEAACPYCSNQIPAGARLCQHCRAILVSG